MYISDKKRFLHMLYIYLGVTAFCGMFSIIYESFSHGVYSPFMVYLFAFPLIGGAVPAALLMILKAKTPPRFVRNAWHSGIATLAAGSCLCGIFEIYGTYVQIAEIYWYVGGGLCVIALAGYAISRHISGAPSNDAGSTEA